MIELLQFLHAKPWWASRFMWGLEAARFLVVDAVWHSNFSMELLNALDEDVLA